MPWTSWQFMNFATGMWVDAIMDSMPRIVTFKAICVVQVTNLIDPSYESVQFYCVLLVVHGHTCRGQFGPSIDD